MAAPIVFTPHPGTMGVGYAGEVLGEALCTAPRGNTGWAGSLNTRTTVLEGIHLCLWVRGQNSGPRRGSHEVAGAGWEDEASSLPFRGCCGPQAAVRRPSHSGPPAEGWQRRHWEGQGVSTRREICSWEKLMPEQSPVRGHRDHRGLRAPHPPGKAPESY